MKDIIRKIEKLQEERQNMLPMREEYQSKLDKKFRLEFNYNSNHLEGNTLTYGETELLLIFDIADGNHTFREHNEMKAHDVALQKIKEWAKDSKRTLTEGDIRDLNKIILVEPFWKEAVTSDGIETKREIKIGDYKDFPNNVRLRNGEVFEFASVIDTPILMRELIEWYRNREQIIGKEFAEKSYTKEQRHELSPVETAALLHYKFVCIHPFDDGNGRVARLLMNYVLYRFNFPPIVIKSADKRNYLEALSRADSGDVDSFVEYIAQQLVWSLELSIKAAKGESIEEDDDIDKEIYLWKKVTSTKVDEILYRNDEVIYDLYVNNLKEILTQFDNKVKQFDDMFNEKTSYIVVNGRGTTIDSKFYNNKLDEELLKSKEINENNTLNDSYTDISIRITFNSYKYQSDYPLQIFAELKIEFQSQKYKVLFNNTTLVEKSYREFLNADERKKIVADCIKSVFEEIKQKSGNKS